MRLYTILDVETARMYRRFSPTTESLRFKKMLPSKVIETASGKATRKKEKKKRKGANKQATDEGDRSMVATQGSYSD